MPVSLLPPESVTRVPPEGGRSVNGCGHSAQTLQAGAPATVAKSHPRRGGDGRRRDPELRLPRARASASASDGDRVSAKLTRAASGSPVRISASCICWAACAELVPVVGEPDGPPVHPAADQPLAVQSVENGRHGRVGVAGQVRRRPRVRVCSRPGSSQRTSMTRRSRSPERGDAAVAVGAGAGTAGASWGCCRWTWRWALASWLRLSDHQDEHVPHGEAHGDVAGHLQTRSEPRPLIGAR